MNTWERSATHEIHGSPNQNDLRKKIRRLFACFVQKQSAGWSAHTKLTNEKTRKVPDDAPRIGSGDGKPGRCSPRISHPLGGLVNEVVPAADLITRSETILKQIFANAPLAVKYALEAVNKGLQTSQDEGLSLEASLFGLCEGTEDKKEGAQAFLQKRAAQFQGR
jgi:Enoyl-CoA hydratase/isomerase